MSFTTLTKIINKMLYKSYVDFVSLSIYTFFGYIKLIFIYKHVKGTLKPLNDNTDIIWSVSSDC